MKARNNAELKGDTDSGIDILLGTIAHIFMLMEN